ncbi:MAG: pyridoxamine 5'-phosphate oxidase family protein [Prevotellaceae bacterium]|jgi:uncharacterized protein YhbP (UPF0306 family)|nr:pyridoxamine 5'-phosphate oxidase family protein [Prevotellaceae bacterium]
MERTKIANFIKEHHVLTLATCVDSTPYCSNMFYILIEDEFCLVFLSGKETRHIAEALKNQTVAGSIVLETETVGQIQGLQFCGKFSKLPRHLRIKAKKQYLKRFPYAIFSGAQLWIIKIHYAKLTDNRFGFGKKIIWHSVVSD